MYLSLLKINTNLEPSRNWFNNIYEVHHRLWMAFPKSEQEKVDPFFLGTWTQQVKKSTIQRDELGFLFRIERDADPRIIVQSKLKPNWEYAFQNADWLLKPETKPIVRIFETSYSRGEKYKFRIVANPTVKRNAKRVSLKDQGEQLAWFYKKSTEIGSKILEINVTESNLHIFKDIKHLNSKNNQITLFSVTYEGILEVATQESLSNAVIKGIGPAKGFGCGLLSLSSVSTKETKT